MSALPTAPQPSRFRNIFRGESRVLPAVQHLRPRDRPDGISEQAELIVGPGLAGSAVTARGVLRTRTTRTSIAMFFGGLAITVVHTEQDILRGFGLAAFLVGMFYAFLIWMPQMLSLLYQGRVVIDGTTLFVRQLSRWERIDLCLVDKLLLEPQRAATIQTLAGKSFTHVNHIRVATFPDPTRDDIINQFLLPFEALRRVAAILPTSVQLRMSAFLTDEELVVAHIFATARANPDHASWSLLGTKELKAFSALCAGRPLPENVAMVRYAYGAVQQDPVGSDGAVTAADLAKLGISATDFAAGLAKAGITESELAKTTVSRAADGEIMLYSTAGGGHDQKVKKSQRKAVLMAVAVALIYVLGQILF